MATTSIRTAAKQRIVEMLTPIHGVEVYYSWTGPTPERDHIRVGAPPTTGTVNIPVMTAGRKRRDDRFSFSIYLLASVPGRTHIEAEERCEEMYAAVEDVLAADPSLGGLDGVVTVELGDSDGPDSDPTDQGALAYMRCSVNIHARLH